MWQSQGSDRQHLDWRTMSSAEEPLRPDGSSVLRRLQVWQAIERRWSHALDLHERMLLLRVCDMTVGWGDLFIDASLSQIVDGDGDRLGPIGFKLRTAETSLVGLRAKGLVVTEQLKRGKSIIGLRFTPNIDLILLPWEGTMAPTIREPKRLKQVDNQDTPRTTCGTPPHDMRDPTAPHAGPPRTTCGVSKGTIKPTQENSKKATPSPSAPVDRAGFSEDEEILSPVESSKSAPEEKSAAAKIAEITSRKTERRATELQTAVARLADAKPWVKGERAKDAVRIDDLALVWTQTFAEVFGYAGMPMAWTKIERGQAKHLFTRWLVKPDGSKPNGEFSDFLVWSITNWGDVRAKEFGWMKSPGAPEHPSILFLAKFADRFEDAWLTRKRKTLLNNWELDEIAELRLKGYSDVAAIEVVVRRKMGKALRDAKAAPKAPTVRPRQAPPVQRVAAKEGLPNRAPQPTNVVQELREAKGWAAASAIFDTPPEETQ